ncbi:hypothetical protein BHE74_00007965 [Ensete ventricosum]|nr:hypothetical protein GW17_00009457 [Ensete ventricosum]RWW83523.1 hypothetical protein BHE74_00007965 [Ensete ventricosum]RZR93693.1 hypothetical protein BHM03_00022237 [Ensete ventricosum]
MDYYFYCLHITLLTWLSISSELGPMGARSISTQAGVDVKKNVIVTITSDKGLCGGINSTSVRVSKALYKLTSGTIHI